MRWVPECLFYASVGGREGQRACVQSDFCDAEGCACCAAGARCGDACGQARLQACSWESRLQLCIISLWGRGEGWERDGQKRCYGEKSAILSVREESASWPFSPPPCFAMCNIRRTSSYLLVVPGARKLQGGGRQRRKTLSSTRLRMAARTLYCTVLLLLCCKVCDLEHLMGVRGRGMVEGAASTGT